VPVGIIWGNKYKGLDFQVDGSMQSSEKKNIVA
jgi:hypothetical protein